MQTQAFLLENQITKNYDLKCNNLVGEITKQDYTIALGNFELIYN